MNGPRPIARFSGGVSCLRDSGPLGLTLIGRTSDHPAEVVSLSFAAPAPEDLPEALEDAAVERVAATCYRISSGSREWLVPAGACHLHREVAARFYQAVAPRSVPWSKRIFWWLVLTLAASPTGKRVLLALRRG